MQTTNKKTLLSPCKFASIARLSSAGSMRLLALEISIDSICRPRSLCGVASEMLPTKSAGFGRERKPRARGRAAPVTAWG